MNRDEIITLARATACKHNLWPELVCAIVEQESGFNPWAMRYEPAFFFRYIQPLREAGQIKTETEARARAFSWGLMQVMGQVAREHGFAGQYLSALCEPEIGLDVGCRVFNAKLARAEGNLRNALLIWNGGSRPEYANEVLARVEKFA